MTKSVTVKIRKKDALLQRFKKMAPAAERELKVANRKSAVEMARNARSYVPVGRTGRLQKSIIVTTSGQMPPMYSQGAPRLPVPKGSAMVTAGNGEVRYAHLVEFGSAPHKVGGQFAGATHPGSAPRPYFWPAYRLVSKKHKGRATKALNTSIKKAGSA